MDQDNVITSIVVDSELRTTEVLVKMLMQVAEIKVCETFQSGEDALDFLSQNYVDLIFLEIELATMSGLNVIAELAKYNYSSSVIIVTGHPEFAIDAIKMSVFDYLLKPVDLDELHITLRRFRFEHHHKLKHDNHYEPGRFFENDNKLKIKNNRGYDYLCIEQIVYIKADGNYSWIRMEDGNSKISSMQLGALENLLNKSTFMRISRKHLVNIHFVSSFDKPNRILTLTTSSRYHEVLVSKSKVSIIEGLA